MTKKKVETSNLEKAIAEKNLSPEEVRAVIDSIKNPQRAVNTIKHHWGSRHCRIGGLSDTHIGSKFFNPVDLNDIFKRFKAEGVDAVYHAGDLTEGYNRRKGHSFECELHGADAQVKGVVELMPYIGKPIYYLTGDHDKWHWESAGVNIGEAVQRQRSDMIYLGDCQAKVQLFPETTMELVHPAKGTAYALSYQIQKWAEGISGGQKPQIALIGHYHKIEYLFYRNIHIFQTGCVQNQTNWMKRMNLSAHKGAWILDIYARKGGWIDRVDMKLLAYYE